MRSLTSTGVRIAAVWAREILDSRGRPTVEAEVTLEDGSSGRASAPSGASTGRHEARELRDGDADRYEGRGVRRAVVNVRDEIAAALLGRPALDQSAIDETMTALDPDEHLGRLGANAVLATSLAVARAAAAFLRQPLYRYLGTLAGKQAEATLPMPMTNILSGGAHAGRDMDFQDFLAVPVGARSYSQALEWISRVRTEAARLMTTQNLSVLLADEGGLAPGYPDAEQALQLLTATIDAARPEPRREVALAIDVASSELFSTGARVYELRRLGRRLSGEAMAAYVAGLCRRHPIISVEDPLEQDDWEAWRIFTAMFPDRGLQILGDDLFVTNAKRIAMGIERGVANAVLIKLNQNGTLSGTLGAMSVARQAGYATVVSARSGETDDAFIADLAVATGAGQIKIGSVRSAERQAKYNQLLRIEEDTAVGFAGVRGIAGFD
jgi:enolase